MGCHLWGCTESNTTEATWQQQQQRYHIAQQSYFLGIYLKKIICTLVFITALFTIAETWKQLKCASTNKWMKKMWYMYIQWNIT